MMKHKIKYVIYGKTTIQSQLYLYFCCRWNYYIGERPERGVGKMIRETSVGKIIVGKDYFLFFFVFTNLSFFADCCLWFDCTGCCTDCRRFVCFLFFVFNFLINFLFFVLIDFLINIFLLSFQFSSRTDSCMGFGSHTNVAWATKGEILFFFTFLHL